MCLKKIYFNTYADGSQEFSEKTYTCRKGQMCLDPEVRTYNRSFPFSKMGEADLNMPIGIPERNPLPYYPMHLPPLPPSPRMSKSPSPSSRHDTGVYVNGVKVIDTHKPRKHHKHSSKHHAADHPRDRHERDPPSPRPLKRSSTMPREYVVIDQQERPPRTINHDYSQGIPIGPIHLAPGLSRRHSNRDHDRETNPHLGHYSYRQHSKDPQGFVVIDDEKEQRQQRRERRRKMTAEYPDFDVLSSSGSGAIDAVYTAPPPSAPAPPVPPKYTPIRRSSTIVHRHDSKSDPANLLGTSPSKSKHLRWEDEARVKREKRERQNAEIANRPIQPDGLLDPPLKGILKPSSTFPIQPSDDADVHELRRAMDRLAVPDMRRRDPDDDMTERLRGRFDGEVDRERKRRSKVWLSGGRYEYL
ncbi:hypothetical protein B0T22DRAFT_279407 [Podospora appendiculata]|uniref:Uncharacterized protein n=1 Tax=Podospora appendiculata TaxID=314037 RepID=A0AAE1C800_9PEZI|nr:hypothetical protein B0T22DRAFT_279407 [Podospora appendiculata]